MKNLICISVLLCLCSFAYCQGEGVTGDYSKTDFRGEFDLTDPASEKLDVLRIGYDRGRNVYTFKIGSADDVDGGFTLYPESGGSWGPGVSDVYDSARTVAERS